MATSLPLPGLYFRKGHFDDRLIDGLITVRVSVAVITPLGVEEKEMTFSGSTILEAIQNMLAILAGVSGTLGVEMSAVLGGTLPSAAQQRQLSARATALAEPVGP